MKEILTLKDESKCRRGKLKGSVFVFFAGGGKI
jgi:hypothetical protein